MPCVRIKRILPVLTRAASARAADSVPAAIWDPEANSTVLLATSRPRLRVALADPVDGAVPMAAAAVDEAVVAALPAAEEGSQGAVEASAVAVEAVDAAVAVAGAVPADEDAAVRMPLLSATARDDPQTRSGRSYFSPRETRFSTRGLSRSTARCRIRARTRTIATA